MNKTRENEKVEKKQRNRQRNRKGEEKVKGIRKNEILQAFETIKMDLPLRLALI